MLVGQKIKKLRELKNLTQEYVATELGITQSAYSKIESGDVDVPYTKLEQIAKTLDLSVEDIITFNEHIAFNIMHNKVANGMVINHSSENEKKLYVDNIEQLKSENAYLKNVLDKLLLTDKKEK